VLAEVAHLVVNLDPLVQGETGTSLVALNAYPAEYMIALGTAALLIALLLPRGVWGTVEARFGLRLLPVGYRLETRAPEDPPRTGPSRRSGTSTKG